MSDSIGPPLVGVLALQGAVRAHVEVLERCGASTRMVRTVDDLNGIDGLVLPGGESTTMSMQIDRNGLREPLQQRLDDGLAVLGTCAGLILLSVEVLDGRDDQMSYGAIDVDVRRNGYGRQVASFERDLDIDGCVEPFTGVFIRAPRIERVGAAVSVLAELEGDPVLVATERVLASAFHPELSGDDCVHRLFLSSCAEPRAGATIES